MKNKFKIGDVAKKLNLKKDIVRFWGKEFNIQPAEKFYGKEELDAFEKIKTLIREKGLSLNDAKNKFNTIQPAKLEAKPQIELEATTQTKLETKNQTELKIETQIKPNLEIKLSLPQENQHIQIKPFSMKPQEITTAPMIKTEMPIISSSEILSLTHKPSQLIKPILLKEALPSPTQAKRNLFKENTSLKTKFTTLRKEPTIKEIEKLVEIEKPVPYIPQEFMNQVFLVKEQLIKFKKLLD